MEPRLFHLRLTAMRVGVLAVLAVLTGRLWHLQIAGWARYDKKAQSNRTETVWTPAPRGTIYDRNGKVLADNQVVYQIQITPSKLPGDHEEFNAAVVLLASVLNVSTVDVETAIDQARKAREPDVVLPQIGDGIDRLQAIRLDEHRADMPGIRAVEARRRHYPGSGLAAHVLGYARAISSDEYLEVQDLIYDDPPGAADNGVASWSEQQPIYFPDSIYGKTGVEHMAEGLARVGSRRVPILQGRRGADEFEVDAYNEPRLIHSIPPTRGASVYLTIDRRWQRATEAALAHPFPLDPARPCPGGAAALVDVRTGEILVLASYPAVDLNEYVQGFPSGYDKIRLDLRQPELNRAIAGLYPPASAFKMISACAALEQTSVNLGTVFNCTGRIYVGREHQRKTCWQRAGHGWVDFERAIAESCDVYFWEAVRKAGLSAGQIAEYARDFGLGELTGCGLPNEQEGLVPTPEWKRQVKDEKWYTGDTINLVIGQYSLTTTPLQMALVTATVANDGLLPEARIIRKVVWPEESGIGSAVWPSEEPHRVRVKAETLEAVRRGMRAAVVYQGGTARTPMSGLPISVAAKTGSAETFPGKTPHSWFVCFAPYERPKYACAVIVEHGGYGSEVAGYVVRKMLLTVFGGGVAQRGSPGEATDVG